MRSKVGYTFILVSEKNFRKRNEIGSLILIYITLGLERAKTTSLFLIYTKAFTRSSQVQSFGLVFKACVIFSFLKLILLPSLLQIHDTQILMFVYSSQLSHQLYEVIRLFFFLVTVLSSYFLRTMV